jgi:hypothetical protein
MAVAVWKWRRRKMTICNTWNTTRYETKTCRYCNVGKYFTNYLN